jgi:hypothetical protein
VAASQSLRTNLPTAVMQLDDFAFPPGLPSFVSHTDVLAYIQSYAAHCNVSQLMPRSFIPVTVALTRGANV